MVIVFAPALSPADAASRPRAIATWLFVVAALVFAMVVVGGITRLTESGLSITRWNVVSGTLPPIGDAAWAAEFDAYRLSPQYRLLNQGMDIAAFKHIFFWEYLHRLLGRVIGLAAALPLAWFWLRRAIPAGYKPRLLAIVALIGLQGTLGWRMVASGLQGEHIAVEHLWLAAHLFTALTILAAFVWTALDLRRNPLPVIPAQAGIHRRNAGAMDPRLRGDDGGRNGLARPDTWVIPFGILLAVQIIWGAFVAGMRAGHVSDTWPLMFGQLVPAGLFTTAADLIDSPLTVHFLHRTLAIVVALAALHIAAKLWRAGARPRALALGGAVVAQFALGVLTVVNGVPIPLGVAHQACGALLVAATAWAAHWAMQGGAVQRV